MPKQFFAIAVLVSMFVPVGCQTFFPDNASPLNASRAQCIAVNESLVEVVNQLPPLSEERQETVKRLIVGSDDGQVQGISDLLDQWQAGTAVGKPLDYRTSVSALMTQLLTFIPNESSGSNVADSEKVDVVMELIKPRENEVGASFNLGALLPILNRAIMLADSLYKLYNRLEDGEDILQSEVVDASQKRRKVVENWLNK